MSEAMEELRRVQVLQRFKLNREDGHSVVYTPDGTNCGEPGWWDMPVADAEHWFTKPHCANPPPPIDPLPGTTSAANKIRAAKRQDILSQAAQDEENRLAAERVRRGRQADMKRVLGDSFSQSP